MYDSLRDLTGVEFPLFAFSHCRDVVAAVSRAGGFGVQAAGDGRADEHWDTATLGPMVTTLTQGAQPQ